MKDIYKSKKVIVTGHTGFKGSWLCCWLTKMGAEVIGISDDIPTSPSNFEAIKLNKKIRDIRIDLLDKKKVSEVIQDIQPDFIFHLAAQALVRSSYDDPLSTIKINSIGTAHILDCINSINKDLIAVMITSDKVYDNVEWLWGYKESDRLGGKDPYSASKGMAELVIRTYFHSFFNKENSRVKLAISRAGNVIGGGDWAKDRIVPDCVRAWSKGDEVEIRNPKATRPWQHVLEPLSGYLHLATSLSEDPSINGEAFNFGPSANSNYSVGELVSQMERHWDKVKWRDVSASKERVYEASLLKLNCDKALHLLDWKPTLDFKETVQLTVDWYKKFYEKDQDMSEFTFNQIDNYEKLAMKRGAKWLEI